MVRSSRAIPAAGTGLVLRSMQFAFAGYVV